jgi:hypothetical protein
VTPHGGQDSYIFPEEPGCRSIEEDVMYDPPAYLWVITIAGPTGIAAATCIVLYDGAERAGLGRRRAAAAAR